MTEEHRNFIRITWKEAVGVLTIALQNKYKAEGKIRLMKDEGSNVILLHYIEPDFVEIELEK